MIDKVYRDEYHRDMKTFHGDEKLKAAMLAEISKHEDMDVIVQGSYGKENGHWKGCAVACSLRSLSIIQGKPLVTEYSEHQRYETDLGIPRIIARLEDRIFEGLSKEESKTFPRRFIEAINVGADLSLVWAKFAVWLLVDEKDGVLKYAKREGSIKSIKRVAELYQKQIDGEMVDTKTWKEARTAAAAAAYAAYAAYAYADAAAYAYAAAAAAAADAAAYADADADAAADAAAYAADAAAYAAAYAARKQWYSKCAKKLIEILKETV